jgi:hypothetical protein
VEALLVVVPPVVALMVPLGVMMLMMIILIMMEVHIVAIIMDVLIVANKKTCKCTATLSITCMSHYSSYQ